MKGITDVNCTCTTVSSLTGKDKYTFFNVNNILLSFVERNQQGSQPISYFEVDKIENMYGSYYNERKSWGDPSNEDVRLVSYVYDF